MPPCYILFHPVEGPSPRSPALSCEHLAALRFQSATDADLPKSFLLELDGTGSLGRQMHWVATGGSLPGRHHDHSGADHYRWAAALQRRIKRGDTAVDFKLDGFSAGDCRRAGVPLEDIVLAGFSSSDIARAFGLRKLERKDDSERRVGARVLCEGKLGKITKHQASEYAWNYVKIRYDDGTTNRDNTGGLGYVRFVNTTGEKYPTGTIWVGVGCCSSKT